MIRLSTVALGGLFGFFLSRGRATDYDAIAGMFRLRDPHLALLMIAAIGTAAIGLALLKARRVHSLAGPPVAFKKKPLGWGNVAGGAVFGIGWGLGGQCPGTSIGQLGEGKWLAAITVVGLGLGTWLYAYGFERSRWLRRLDPASRPVQLGPAAPASSDAASTGC